LEELDVDGWQCSTHREIRNVYKTLVGILEGKNTTYLEELDVDGRQCSTHREISNASKNLVGTLEGKILLGRTGYGWTGNITVQLKSKVRGFGLV
jgi:extradiol dioxygenase family protein